MFFPKKSPWNILFLVLSGKVTILFPESMILHPDGKWKMIFLKKIHGNMIFSSNNLKRLSFQKASRWEMIFLVLSGKVVFFSRKCGVFSLDRGRGRGDLSQEIHGNMIFPFDIFHAPLPKKKKNQRWSYSAKIHLKVIDILAQHPRKSSSNSL